MQRFENHNRLTGYKMNLLSAQQQVV